MNARLVGSHIKPAAGIAVQNSYEEAAFIK